MAKAKHGTRAAGSSRLIVATKAAAREARRKKLAALQRLIRRRLATVTESFYDVGVALREILEQKLYAAAGHASLGAYLGATKLLSLTLAEKLIAIVRQVPREDALAAGQERAFAMIALAAATPEADTAAELIAHGTVDGEPAKTASVRAIRAEAKAQAARHPKTKAQSAKTKADAAVDKGLRAWLKKGGLRPETVRVTGRAVHVTLTREQVETLIASEG